MIIDDNNNILQPPLNLTTGLMSFSPKKHCQNICTHHDNNI